MDRIITKVLDEMCKKCSKAEGCFDTCNEREQMITAHLNDLKGAIRGKKMELEKLQRQFSELTGQRYNG